MAKNKFYAVKKGKTTGIFHTWDECRRSVDRYPGAEYKSFATEQEANAYLYGEEEKVTTDHVIAYVDGSFDAKIGKYSFGCVLLTPDGTIIKKSGNGDNPKSLALRNVTGEMLGAMYAVKWCEKNGFSSVEICYDYSGIEMWAVGQWKAKKELTQKYAAFMKSSPIKISFRKIAAHTGNRYNEEADSLAKDALLNGSGIPDYSFFSPKKT